MTILHADICLIGNELNGLIAGALLAQKGHRVSIFNFDESFGSEALGDILAPIFPTLFLPASFGPVAEVIESLELRAEFKNRFLVGAPLGLIDDPRQRIIFNPISSEIRSELERVLPNEARELASKIELFDYNKNILLLEEAKRLGENKLLSLIRNYRASLTKNKESDPPDSMALVETLKHGSLAPYLATMAPFLQNSANLGLDYISTHCAVGAIKTSVLFPASQNFSSYDIAKTIFLEAILRHGGEIHEGIEISQATCQRKQIQLLKTSGPNQFVPNIVIDATSDMDFANKVDQPKLRKIYQEQNDQLANVTQNVILRWLLPRRQVPHILPPLSFLVPRGNGAPKATILGQFWPNQKQYPDTVLLVFAALFNRHDNDCLQKSRQIMEQLLPFAKGHALLSDNFTGAKANLAWPRLMNLSTKANHFGGRPMSTPFRNVLRAGRDLAPDLGIHGEFATGLALAEKATKIMESQKKRQVFGFKSRHLSAG